MKPKRRDLASMAIIVEALDIHTYNALMTELQGGIEMDSLTFLKELPER